MNKPLQRAEIERFAGLMAEKRRRQAKALHKQRGHRDADGIWRGGLLEFVRYFWHILEPGTPFVNGMAMEAICQHLEAVTYGEITKLLMNVSPGFSKSILTDVMWPAFEWGPMEMPHLRYVAFSYSSSLTERDNLRFRDLITSPEYQAMYGDHVNVRKTGETKVSNWKHGWKLASSVGGVGTGERGDRIICVSGGTKILTNIGEMRIDQIVQGEMNVSVAGYDHEYGILNWQKIEFFEENPGNAMVKIEHENGSFECTTDHPVYVEGLGYIRADQVKEGMVLWTLWADAMPALWDDNSPQAERDSEVLRQAVSVRAREDEGAGGQQSPLCCVQDDGLFASGTPRETQGAASVLQPPMPRHLQSRCAQSRISVRSRDHELPAMPEAVQTEVGRVGTSERSMLLDAMRDPSEVGIGVIQGKKIACDDVSFLLKRVQAYHSEKGVLFAPMCRNQSFQADAGGGEWPLRPRPNGFAVPQGMEQEAQSRHTDTGQQPMSALSAHPSGGRAAVGCASHRLCEGQSGPDELDHLVPLLPQPASWRHQPAQGLEKTIVRSVTSAGVSTSTFNLRVSPCHNYFANGILVHNCDDPHNVKESESKAVRQETIRWFRESMSSRLNDMENGAKVVIMQRVNEEDVAGEIISKMDGWCHLLLPMEFVWTADENGHAYETDIGWVDPRWKPRMEDCDGDLAWPERFPERIIPGMKKDVGPFGWHAQYQQTPEVRGGAIFERDWWQPWEPADGKFPPFTYIVASCDSAFGNKSNADPSACVVLGIFENEHGFNRVMVIEAWRRNLKFSGPVVLPQPGEKGMAFLERQRKSWGLVEWLADTCTRRKVDRLLIENKASGISASQSLANSHPHAGWAVQLVEPKGDKWARAQSVQPTFSQEMVHIPWPLRQWGADLIDELAIYDKGTHDDQVDAMTQGIKHLRDIGLLRNDSEIRQDLVEAAKPKGRAKKLYPGTAGKAA